MCERIAGWSGSTSLGWGLKGEHESALGLVSSTPGGEDSECEGSEALKGLANSGTERSPVGLGYGELESRVQCPMWDGSGGGGASLGSVGRT